MDLETYQLSLYRLVVYGKPASDDPPYVQALAGSSRLAVVREVVHFWRAHGLERFCILTVIWLKYLRRFEADIERFVATEKFSPFIEEAGQQFLQYLANDDDPIVQSLAKFEIALHETRIDPSEKRIVEWPCDPRPILAVILKENNFIDPKNTSRYRVTISRALPGGFVCEPIESNPPAWSG